MKKILTFFLTGAAIAALATACNSTSSTDTKDGIVEIEPIPISNEIATAEDMSRLTDIVIRDKDLFNGSDICVIINSAEELPIVDNDGFPVESLSIDFDSHTIVLGSFFATHGGLRIIDQRVIVEADKITLQIDVDSSNLGAAIPLMKPFWGLYPKLPNLPINVVRK